MNSLTQINQTSTSVCPVADRALSDQVATLKNNSEERGASLVLFIEPSVELRTRMQSRLRILNQNLSRGDRHAIASAVAGMLGSYGSARGRGDEAKATVAKYVEVLEAMPLWAVQLACSRISAGHVDGVSLDFPPSTARLRQVVEAIVMPWWEEQIGLHKVLTAEIEHQPDPTERERMIGKFNDLLAKLSGRIVRDREPANLQGADP